MEYGLIGEKLGHSYSKIIHEKLADYDYELTPLSKVEFESFMEVRDFKAINVTIPYKRDVIPYLDEMDDNAKRIGAVNTIVNKNGKLIGHNTDFFGFLYMIKHNSIIVENKKVIVLGNGGAAQAVLAVFEHLKAQNIIIVKRISGDGVISYEECRKYHSDAQLIVNTSPVGMYPNVDSSPIDLTLYQNCEAVLDIIYNPLKTKLLLQAEELGMKAVNGLEMLVAQAKYAVEFFLDKDIKDEVIDEIHEKILADITGHDF
ncbi:shikimate dehydrogenase family protein [Anaerocolumna sp. MB42-C2]|uniref:shikimate dehydrogenase family protein n=1 Tax=Anaerocolumna sp. MB42-C2 TaxID=3070997 RepID=UPI0027E012FC|nr:shikimate dehydrogenase [Anaerocolumna sp. MB42-C2]WMJ87642.1 shikimate dehydrogenase [Anaerocolumna sp. MB42-C2]